MAKQKKCKAKNCTGPGVFTPFNSLHNACTPKCALEIATEKRKLKERKDTKARLEALKPYSYWVNKTQKACNSYIRERDKNKPCISCGWHGPAQYHAGHFMSAGARKGLRFHPLNIHLQCSQCNNKKSGNYHGYREGLIKKIGRDNVRWLEDVRIDYAPTVEELKEIETHYKKLKKELTG